MRVFLLSFGRYLEMDELISTIATDLNIISYFNEPEDSFAARVIYSSIGIWTLTKAKDVFTTGYDCSSKIHITNQIRKLVGVYTKLYPEISNYFTILNSPGQEISVWIRETYETTGYLIETDNKSRTELVSNDRIVGVGKNDLYFGIPSGKYSMSGLGVYIQQGNERPPIISTLFIQKKTAIEVVEEFFSGMYLKFKKWDFSSYSNLEFFNPKEKLPLSACWVNDAKTDKTIIRNDSYYIALNSGKACYIPEVYYSETSGIFKREMRRLQYGLKSYYDNSEIAKIVDIDLNYYRLKLQSHLPFYEGSILLLLGWPVRNYSNRVEYVMPMFTKESVKCILKHLTINLEEK